MNKELKNYEYPGEKQNLNYWIAGNIYNLLEGYKDYTEVYINNDKYVKVIAMCDDDLREALNARKDYKKVITFYYNDFSINKDFKSDLMNIEEVRKIIKNKLDTLIPSKEEITQLQYLVY